MNNVSTSKKTDDFSAIKKVLIGGFLLRIAVLIFIFTVGTMFSNPYFLSDDISYENLARYYLYNAKGVFDFDLFDRITRGYMQSFWPLVECISAKLFNNMYAGRIINIILSTSSVYVIYKLTFEISNNGKTALTAAKLFAFLPISVLTCCFPIKDIYITFGVMYAFYIFVRIQKGTMPSVKQIIFCSVLLVGVYFSRGAVVEMLLIFLFVYYMQKLIREGKYTYAILWFVFAIILFVIFYEQILGAFQTKIDDYSGYAETGDGINIVKVTGLSNIYKLPLAYAWATLQPVKLSLVSLSDNIWFSLIGYLNISIYPIAVGNFIYIFYKKHNTFFWLSSFIMYSAVIILSLGIFRHYLFLLPIEMINFSLFLERKPRENGLLCMICAFGMFLVIFLASLLNYF